MKKYLLIIMLFISLINSSSAITIEEAKKYPKREVNKLFAMRGITFGMFAWSKEDLSLDGKIKMGCLDRDGIMRMNEDFVNRLCDGWAWARDKPTCPESYISKFRKRIGEIFFLGNDETIVAPYFRPLTEEETKEIFGNKTPTCYNLY